MSGDPRAMLALVASAVILACGATPGSEVGPAPKIAAPVGEAAKVEAPRPGSPGPITTPEPVAVAAPTAGAVTASVPDKPGAPTIEVDKTAFRITLPGGHVLADNEMIGVILTVRDEANAWRKVRIDEIMADPRDPEITLYDLSVQDPQTNAWGPLCGPGPDGLARAMPLAGVWTADGRHEAGTGAFNVTCTSGAIGKCVRFGYKPWLSDLWDYHQSCVRMLRGDYCGDGQAFTKNGMLVNIGDRREIQRLDDSASLVFEAGWGPAGALCVHHPRVPESTTLAALEARCPDRLRGRTGAACTRDSVVNDPQFRLFNHSAAPPE